MAQTLFITLTALFSGFTGSASLVFPTHMSVKEVEPAAKISKVKNSDEILWLARVIFSETKNEDEMKLIGWVVRNRVKAGYRGTTYKEVALSKNQFSGLNQTDSQYVVNINMGYKSKNEKWIKALAAASEVYFADEQDRPFSKDVKHFYSPMSVAETPNWALEGELDYTIPGSDGEAPRFAFYSGVK
jgi:hypothetical protein